MQIKLISVGARNPECLEVGISAYRLKQPWLAQFGSGSSEATDTALTLANNQSQGRAGRIS